MTLRGAIHHLLRFISGTAVERRYTLYLIGMKFRGIDLSGVGVEALGLSVDHSHRYANSGGPDLDIVVRTLPLSSADAVIDIGCGKGGAMLTMAKYNFARIDGIEISPRLAKLAEMNLLRAGVKSASVFCCDAGDFTDLDPYTVIYMFNPFPETVMSRVMENVSVSMARRKRTLTLIYKNPVCDRLISGAGFRKTREFDLRFQHSRLPFQIYVHNGHNLKSS